jgi:hypothetical protein
MVVRIELSTNLNILACKLNPFLIFFASCGSFALLDDMRLVGAPKYSLRIKSPSASLRLSLRAGKYLCR